MAETAPHPRPLDGFSLITLAALMSAGFALAAALADVAAESVDLARDLGFPTLDGVWWVAATAGGLAAAGAIAALIAWVPSFREIARRLVPIADWIHMSVAQLAALSLIVAIGEEVFFRGAVQPLVGLWLTALVFGALHWSAPTHALFATAAGLGLGALYQGSESLWPPIAAHFVVDLATGLAAREALRRGWAP